MSKHQKLTNPSVVTRAEINQEINQNRLVNDKSWAVKTSDEKELLKLAKKNWKQTNK